MEKKPGRIADQEEIDMIISMYNAGSTSAEIAEKTGRTRAAIDTRQCNLRKKGLVGKGRAAPAPAEEKPDEPRKAAPPKAKPAPPTVNKEFDACFSAPAESTASELMTKCINLPGSPSPDSQYRQTWKQLVRQIDAERDRLKSLCGDGEIEVKGAAGYYIYLAGQRAALNKLREEAYALERIFDLGGAANGK